MKVIRLTVVQLQLTLIFCQTYSVLLRWPKEYHIDRLSLTLNTLLGRKHYNIDHDYVVPHGQDHLAVSVRLPSEITSITAYDDKQRLPVIYTGEFAAPSDNLLHQVIVVKFRRKIFHWEEQERPPKS